MPLEELLCCNFAGAAESVAAAAVEKNRKEFVR
jgi:hypothetical protein